MQTKCFTWCQPSWKTSISRNSQREMSLSAQLPAQHPVLGLVLPSQVHHLTETEAVSLGYPEVDPLEEWGHAAGQGWKDRRLGERGLLNFTGPPSTFQFWFWKSCLFWMKQEVIGWRHRAKIINNLSFLNTWPLQPKVFSYKGYND